MVPQQRQQCCAVQVYLKAGFPQLRRGSLLESLQAWLQRVGTTTDFQYMMLSAMFLPQQSVSLVCHRYIISLLHAKCSKCSSACCLFGVHMGAYPSTAASAKSLCCCWEETIHIKFILQVHSCMQNILQPASKYIVSVTRHQAL